MNYTLKADNLEVTFQVDGGFVEALLGAVRAAKKPHNYRAYTPYPEDEEVPDREEAAKSDPVSSSAPGADSEPSVDRSSKTYAKWYSFVLMWMRNFDQEGEQPDRGEATRALAHNKSAGKLVAMIGQLGGITHAVHEVVEAASGALESARLENLSQAERDKLSRQVAENITQVSSILFADLSDLLEYHNPLEEEED